MCTNDNNLKYHLHAIGCIILKSKIKSYIYFRMTWLYRIWEHRFLSNPNGRIHCLEVDCWIKTNTRCIFDHTSFSWNLVVSRPRKVVFTWKYNFTPRSSSVNHDHLLKARRWASAWIVTYRLLPVSWQRPRADDHRVHYHEIVILSQLVKHITYHILYIGLPTTENQLPEKWVSAFQKYLTNEHLKRSNNPPAAFPFIGSTQSVSSSDVPKSQFPNCNLAD